jgi:hypothetical protein
MVRANQRTTAKKRCRDEPTQLAFGPTHGVDVTIIDSTNAFVVRYSGPNLGSANVLSGRARISSITLTAWEIERTLHK